MIHAGLNIEKNMLERFKSYELNCIKGAIIGEAEIVDSELNQQLRKIDPIVYGKSNHVET